MPYVPSFINKYGWLWGVILGAISFGVVYADLTASANQSAATVVINTSEINTLKTGQAVLTQKVDDLSDDVNRIAVYIGAKK